jgi:hypothetical protein
MSSEQVNGELNLQLPDSLYSQLSQRAKERGVSLEALCLSILGGDSLIDPSLYTSLSTGQVREEMQKLVESNLPKAEVRKRINQLEQQVKRRIR